MKKPRGLKNILFYVSMFVSQLAYGQQQEPNISFLEQQARVAAQQQEFSRPDALLPKPSLLDLGGLPQGESPCFDINQIELTYGQLYDTPTYHRQFATSLKPLLKKDAEILGQCVGGQGVSYILDRVQNNLLALGYVTTRVELPSQDIKSTNKLLIKVIPGLVGETRYAKLPEELESAKHESLFSRKKNPSLVNTMALKSGDVLNIRDIETSLENFRRLSTAQISIDIAPADLSMDEPHRSKAGDQAYSDLVVTWFQLTPFRGNLSIDDAGSESTGKYQALLSLSIDNPLQIGDEFRLYANTALPEVQRSDTESLGLNFGYSVPLGKTLIDMSYNRYRFDEKLEGLNTDLSYRGKSEGFDVDFERVIYRDQFSKTSASLGGYLKTSKNFIDDEEVEVQRRRTAGWEVGLNHSHYLPDATIDATIKVRRGTGAFNAIEAPEEQFGEGTAQPTILFYSASYVAPLAISGNSGSYRMTINGQYTNDPLIVQDRFYMGGRYTLRGVSGSLVGDQGVLVQQDWTWQPSSYPIQTYLGYDFGVIGGPSTAGIEQTDKTVVSSVVGFRAFLKAFQLSGFMGWGIVTPDYFDGDDKRDLGFSMSYGF